ncbi:MAG: acyl carrier protein [Myxococcota bacterium]
MEGSVEEKVKHIVADQLGTVPAKIELGAKFTDDLEMDSLDVVEMVLAFEEEFDVKIPDDEVKNIVTVSEAIAYIEAHEGEGKSEPKN